MLFIDDDEEFGVLTVRRLERLGFEVHFHRGAFGATAALMQGRYDLILLDLNMPALSGAALLDVIRRQRGLERMRVVLYSSADRLDEVARTHRADGFISKGASLDELGRAIRVALGRPASDDGDGDR